MKPGIRLVVVLVVGALAPVRAAEPMVVPEARAGLDLASPEVREPLARSLARAYAQPSVGGTEPMMSRLSDYARDALDRGSRLAYSDELPEVRAELADLVPVAAALGPDVGPKVVRLHELLSARGRVSKRLREELAAVRREWAADEETVRYPGDPVKRIVPEGARASSEASPLLTDYFGEGKIAAVLNGDAGRGTWQRDVRGAPWLAKRARIVGYEKSEPEVYRQGEEIFNPVVRQRDWRRITIATSMEDARFPKDGTVDLAHVAFLDMGEGWRERLRSYMSRVREGGFLLLAHSRAYNRFDEIQLQLVDEVTRRGSWRQLDYLTQARAPADYPVTEWWRHFAPSGGNFLLIFSKGPAK